MRRVISRKPGRTSYIIPYESLLSDYGTRQAKAALAEQAAEQAAAGPGAAADGEVEEEETDGHVGWDRSEEPSRRLFAGGPLEAA